jgi:hypothetical protein
MLSSTGSGVPLLMTAAIDGAGPYRFMLDTGASRSVVSPRLVAEVGLTPAPSGAVVLGAEGAAVDAAGSVRLERLTLGELEIPAVDALVMDLSPLERTLGERVDGIVSGGEFRGATLVIDFAAGQAWITRGRIRGGARLRDDRLARVRADVAGRDLDVVIDSGSSGAWMLPASGLPLVEMGYASRRVATAGGSPARRRLELGGSVRMAGAVFERPMVEDTAGLPRVGWHGLRGCRVWIDGRSGRVLVERWVEVADGPGWGIGARLERAGDVWEVRGVEPGWPAAAAGLSDGERVLSVEGKRAGELDGAGLATLMQERDRLRLEVLREGGVATVWVPVVYAEP